MLVVGAAATGAVIRVQEGPTEVTPAAAPGTSGPADRPDPFAKPQAGWVMTNWAIQAGDDGSSYRVPPGWRVSSAGVSYDSRDADGAVLARGTAPSYYYGNACSEAGAEIAGAWAVLADPVEGDDLALVAEDAVTAWARGFARNSAGTVAPISAPVTERVTLADGTAAVRSWVEVDMTVFTGPCLPEQAQVAATSAEGEDGVHTLVQTRYLLDSGGLSAAAWSTLAASLRVR